MTLDRLKQFIVKHFEKILVLIILLAAAVGTFFIEDKTLLLNFYFLPVVFASYFLGKRLGVLSAFFSVLAVVACIIVFPQYFLIKGQLLSSVLRLTSWGGFLILTSYAVGSLYEQKERQTLELKNAYIGILEILTKYIDSFDRYTKGHSVRVAEMAMEIAIAMGLSRAEVENVRVAGLLHDIGKIEISSDVLRKAAALTPEEKDLMATHAEKGASILAKVGIVLKEVVPYVLAHHRYYEDLTDNKEEAFKEIPMGARIIAVADAFDAMTTDRPYRKGMQLWEALQKIIDDAGKQFDPFVVGAFRRVITEKAENI
jgi:putative nucleotidyltransferase with HDIG domain